ncbi:hypothetical protein [Tolypothrix sp. VBCCA 56010]|uniref:hypothetical protein n=1 Tax=Tolypothrix sp. VBCCA 56010 TaxID=3137731 RepID=UPI003D7D2BD6
MGHGALGRQCVAEVPSVEASAVIGNNSFPFPFPLSPSLIAQCPLPIAHCPLPINNYQPTINNHRQLMRK